MVIIRYVPLKENKIFSMSTMMYLYPNGVGHGFGARFNIHRHLKGGTNYS